jgi:2-dehydro-3-deoxy-D-pentonate aldolase
MDHFQLGGLFVPLVTPMRAGGALDLGAVGPHVDRLLEAGVEGLVALGTTGEFADLEAGERADVVAAVVAAAGGRVPVLAGVGATGTALAVAHARAAELAGADALLVLPPLYWKLDDDGVVRHYAAVSDASGLPIVLYDFPRLSGTPLSPALVDRLADEVGAVVGIKQSGADLKVTHAVLARVKRRQPGFAVLTGSADYVLPALLGGADGTIAALGNVAPGVLATLVAAVRRGDMATATSQHRLVLDLLAIPGLCNPPILALKAAAAACGSPMEPAVRTNPADADDVARRAADLAHRLLPAGD